MPPAPLLPPPPTLLQSCPPTLIHAIHDIMVVLKIVAQNPAVLASYYNNYRDSYKTQANRLL